MNSEKRKTREHYGDRIRKAVTFMEANQSRVPTLEELSKVAGFSAYHFHRVFHAYVGETVASYLKRIRLERAAMQLCHTEQMVLDVALDAGYETESAFIKAFKTRFKQSPGVFRKSGNATIQPNQNIKLKMQTQSINAESIQKLEPIPIYYVRKTGPYAQAAKEAFGTLMPFLYGNKLTSPDMRCFGISFDDPNVTDPSKLRYEAAATVEVAHEPEGEVQRKDIEGGKYATFLHKGAYETLAGTYDAIFSQWLPESGEQLRDRPVFEEYLNRDPRKTKPENLRTLIYLPLQ